jgi:hypothetical protein
MATLVNKEEILKAVRSMSKEERLGLIAEIASLPDIAGLEEGTPAEKEPAGSDEVMNLTREFIRKHGTLLKRLAE